jgi:hypothetical protein
MPWVRFDDQFPIHRKVKGLTDAEFRLHTEAIFWCARNLTDGYVARDELRDVSGISKPERHLAALVRRGLWVEAEGGWLIHDYLTYQPARAKVMQTREARAEAGRRGGLKSGESRRGSKAEAKPKQLASDGLQHPNPPSSSKKGSGRGPDARPALRLVDDWCGRCDKDRRMAVDDRDRSVPCPQCHPQSEAG